jgi:hypothetical protein
MTVLGVDPGVGGGYCLLLNGKPLFAHEFSSEGDFIDFIAETPIDQAFMEKVSGMPNQSHRSTWVFADNNGFLRGVIRAKGIPLELVLPKEWQKGIGLPRKKLTYSQRKRELRDIATRLCPDLKWTIKTADAYLIARHGANTLSSTG